MKKLDSLTKQLMNTINKHEFQYLRVQNWIVLTTKAGKLIITGVDVDAECYSIFMHFEDPITARRLGVHCLPSGKADIHFAKLKDEIDWFDGILKSVKL